jgi:hypothetical protein
MNGGGTGVDTLRVASCASVDDEVRVHGGFPRWTHKPSAWPHGPHIHHHDSMDMPKQRQTLETPSRSTPLYFIYLSDVCMCLWQQSMMNGVIFVLFFMRR